MCLLLMPTTFNTPTYPSCLTHTTGTLENSVKKNKGTVTKVNKDELVKLVSIGIKRRMVHHP